MYCIADSFFFDYRDRETGQLRQSPTYVQLDEAMMAFDDVANETSGMCHLWAVCNLVGCGSLTVMILEG